MVKLTPSRFYAGGLSSAGADERAWAYGRRRCAAGGQAVFIGLTARTDEQGIREFAAAVEPHGYKVTAIEVSAGLHLKSIVNYVGRNTLLLTEGYVNHPAFNGFNSIVIPEEESYAGNTLWINDTLITPQGYPHTPGEISKLGMPIVQLDTSEFKKMDGGLTCLSLRF